MHIGLLALKIKKKQLPNNKAGVIKTRIIKKKKKKKRVLKKSKRIKRVSKAFSASSIIGDSFKASDYYIAQLNGNSSNELSLFNLVDETLIYPKLFIDYLQRGTVKCHLFINANKIDFNYSKCDGNRFIKTHFLNTFHKALRIVDNKKVFRLRINTEFKLTTDPFKNSQSQNLGQSWYFYKQAYAAITPTQKVLNGIYKTLINTTNWITLLDYLPKNKKALLLEKRYFDRLKNSPYFNL